MGVFGTSREEEANLREVGMTVNDRSRTSFSSTGSSYYDTASEHSRPIIEGGEQNEMAEQEIHPTDDVNTDKEYLEKNEDDVEQQQEQEQDEENDDDETVNHNGSLKSGEEIKDINEGATNMHHLHWDSEDDVDDPMNWGKLKKWYVTLTTAFICLCVSLGSSLFVSGVFDMMAKTGASRELSLAGLSLYLVGLSLGPALGSPISETFGRRIVYITSFPLSMLFTMGVGLSDKIYEILILRFFCGLFASPALAVAGGTINDIWRPEYRGFAAAIFILSPFMGPSLGPVIGNFVAENKGWKWTMWVSLMFSGTILIPVLLLPETYKPIILLKRCHKRNVPTNIPPHSVIIKQTLVVTLLRPIEMLLLDPIVFFWSFYIAFVFAVLFGFFEAFPIIFEGVYKMELGVSGLTFIGVGIGLLLGVIFYIILDLKIFFPYNPDGTRGRRDENGKLLVSPPENILNVGKIGAICLPVSLFWLGWTSRESIHWIVPTLSGIPFGFGLILIFFTNIMYFSFSFPPAVVASALGANNLLRYLFASAFPLFTAQMYEKLKIGWATSIFAFIALALLPIPWIFEKVGPRLRKNSKFNHTASPTPAPAAVEAEAEAESEEIPNEKKEDSLV
ncbi:polyamine transporter 4 [[Candida] jaroonii]|uniref:Polyamine transporter 4 n=1 Tax=[Candida] jaroonii TaxID=467808 RepID=A0ACA9YAF6_9ASCO|nr:polyamine transporter 4 [[Candida] jaroonii]